MISKMILCNKTLRYLRPVQRHMSAKSPAVHETQLPKWPEPNIPFEEWYRKRQVGNNFVFVGGLVFFSLTAYYVLTSDKIFFNLTPPRVNPPRENEN